MATDRPDDDEEEEEKVVRKGEDAKAHKELNKLSGDNEGEKEVDTGKAQNALSQLSNAAEAEKLAKLEREKELAKVKIDKKDVELIMSEMEIDESRAERVLREHNGEPVKALQYLIDSK
ncbi:hypothetical protein GUITHDRAFT_110293 [Guillardia theta CCMP2712]|uniref:Nascent polypeptide-associated complex subunit alpha-like UBA domain-containing protein n=1 Tax=Guillardia theta (strain CCMP2712) TaxID=905079 RepID=L1J5R9_GUITC|nr:hypothetical protein GUITHDRAFT_110293 [Guillardia theta CCMP2712]EKX43841.1 hypothetical protein GUITHDRAFT_110293 [Guillardia theta CCMP2712]|eukprot:XP_005830821.1 hypothetical protein GUITHDRAFT_110293 [Guillardia theta CCMP2712]